MTSFIVPATASDGGKVLAAWSTGEPHRFEYAGKPIFAGNEVTFTAL